MMKLRKNIIEDHQTKMTGGNTRKTISGKQNNYKIKDKMAILNLYLSIIT